MNIKNIVMISVIEALVVSSLAWLGEDAARVGLFVVPELVVDAFVSPNEAKR